MVRSSIGEWIGSRISHYLLVGRLGSGGMGVVYLARDLALGRFAALKLVPPGLDARHKIRLASEGRASARLQHPAIATFYEAGEHDGRAFLAMEFVRGQTLRQRLAQGPLAIHEAIPIMEQLLAAVGHAHFAGILHRDIKPENIMLSRSGGIKLLDFGLATPLTMSEMLELGAETAEDPSSDLDLRTLAALTEAGTVVGTPGYMSPEQVLGEPVDGRSDLFAVGAVLHEVLTGRAAFPGAKPRERIQSMFRPGPPPIEDPALPADLRLIIGRALARHADERYDSATRLLSDLRQACGQRAIGEPLISIAILDARGSNPRADDDWIGAGLADGMADAMRSLPSISAVRRAKLPEVGSDCRTPDLARAASEIGHRLGCRLVLSGEFSRVDDAIRVQLRLFDVATGTGIAESSATGKPEALFDLRDQLYTPMANQLASGQPSMAATSQPDALARPRLEAYQCYVRAEALRASIQRDASQHAKELYERAVQLDPSYAPAMAALAFVTALRFPFTAATRDLELGVEYARQAIAIDPRSSLAHVALGYAEWRLGRLTDGYESVSKAMESDPSNLWALYFGTAMLYEAGRLDEALRLDQRLIQASPEHGYAWLMLAAVHAERGNVEEAIWSCRKAVELEGRPGPGPTVGSAGYLGEYLRRVGQYSEARAQCMAALEAIEKSDHSHRDTFRGMALIALGRAALDENDRDAASAGFTQAVEHVRGRSRMSSAGHILVQGLTGLALVRDDRETFEEALGIFREKRGYDFKFGLLLHDVSTLQVLEQAARDLGLEARANELHEDLKRQRKQGLTQAAVENRAERIASGPGQTGVERKTESESV